MIVEELAASLGLEMDAAAFQFADSVIEGLKNGLLAMGAALGAAAVGLGAVVKSTADMGEAVAVGAQRVGLTRTAYQELTFAGRELGISNETLEHQLLLLSRTAYGAADGSEETAEAFWQLGVQTRTADGHVRSADAILGDVADKFHSMPDGIQKSALAQKVFGRAGAEMIPLLNKGRAGIADLRAEAHRYGVVLSDEVIESSREYVRAGREFEESLQGLKVAIGGPLIEAAAKFTEMLGLWVRQNRVLVAQKIHLAIHYIGVAFKALNQLLRPFVLLAGKVFDVLGGWKTASYVLYGILAGSLLYAIGIAGQALFGLAAAFVTTGIKAVVSFLAAVAGPILLGAAILAALLILEDFYQFITGGDSVIGRFSKTILDFYNNLFKPNPDDWTITLFFKWLWGILIDIQGKSREIWQDFKGSTIGKLFYSETSPAQHEEQAGLALDAFGGGLGPSVFTPPSAAGGAPSINATFNIQASPSMNTEDLAGVVQSKLEDFHDKTMRDAHAATAR